MANELRKIGYELIHFFDGSSNDIIAIIDIQKIDILKDLEKKISG